MQYRQLTNVFVHKAELTNSLVPPNGTDTQINKKNEENASPLREDKFELKSILKLPNENNKNPNVLELYNFESISPYADDKPDIQFNYSPRNLESVQLVDKLNQSQHKINSFSSKRQSVEEILGRIPKEYFRVENRYESIEAVLDHISKRREQFINSINSSPDNRQLSKTIEPIINSVSPHARQKREDYTTFDLGS